jgi:predicted nuclease with TOPRIM domain
MKPYIIEFPLRTIQLSLQDKAQTSIEPLGLDAYFDLHRQLWDIKEYSQQYRKSLDDLSVVVNKLESAYKVMETETKKYGRTAGFPDEMANQFWLEEEKTKGKLRPKKLEELISVFCSLVDQYTKQSADHVEVDKILRAKQEGFDESFNHFNRNYFSPMIHAHEVLQIDTCSLDFDFNEFLETNGKIEKMYDALFDEWESLNVRLTELDGNVKLLDKHFKCLSNTLNSVRIRNQNPDLN